MSYFFKLLTTLFLFFLYINSVQATDYSFRVFFTDKNQTTFSLSNPQDFLSQKAIQRRNKFNITIDSTDLPVNNTYISQILQLTNGTLQLKSKWHNAIVIKVQDSSLIAGLNQLSFYSTSKLVAVNAQGGMKAPLDKPAAVPGEEDFYGDAWDQIHLCKGEYLHNKGYLGAGLFIAVIDAGFNGVPNISAFDSLIDQGRIKDNWNYVKSNNTYTGSDHGTRVLSCMAANLPDIYVGTAPLADYALYITDDIFSEQTIEEDYWTAAAEKADSLGVDIISSSLGYNTFDQTENNYGYSDLDGKSTYLAKTVNEATRKGVLCVISAGNEGNNSWHYMLTPGDADSALTIGSVDKYKTPASSSSWGPNAANQRKPNVVGLGQGAYSINANGNLSSGSGTSFAAPVLAGLIACLMEALPAKSPFEIRNLIQKSADHYLNPNDKVGFGIPNFQTAFDATTSFPEHLQGSFSVYPNPAKDFLYIQPFPEKEIKSILISDIKGKVISIQKEDLLISRLFKINLSSLTPGTYFLSVSMEKGTVVEKILKL